jgi:hypothetical protein
MKIAVNRLVMAIVDPHEVFKVRVDRLASAGKEIQLDSGIGWHMAAPFSNRNVSRFYSSPAEGLWIKDKSDCRASSHDKDKQGWLRPELI